MEYIVSLQGCWDVKSESWMIRMEASDVSFSRQKKKQGVFTDFKL